MSSGSDHMRSQKGPSCGISHTRSIVRICGGASGQRQQRSRTTNYSRVSADSADWCALQQKGTTQAHLI